MYVRQVLQQQQEKRQLEQQLCVNGCKKAVNVKFQSSLQMKEQLRMISKSQSE